MAKLSERLRSAVPAGIRCRLPGWSRAGAPAITLLWVSARRTARVDGDPAGKMLGEARTLDIGCEGPERLAEAVEAALAGSKPLGRKVWILHDGLCLQTVTLPTSQVAGLEPEMLNEALRFELEATDGESTAGQQLSSCLVSAEDGMNSYAVCLAQQGLLEQLQKTVRRRGAVLAGLGHPGGLPRCLSGSAGTWLRLEHWPASTVGIARSEQGKTWLQVFKAPSQAGQPVRELERWRKILPPLEILERLNHQAMLEPDGEATSLSMDRSEHLARWLGFWLEQLAGDPGAMPLLRPAPRSLPEPLWSGLIAGLALAVCLGHYLWFAHQAAAFQAETERLKKAEAEMKTLNEAIKKREEEKTKLDQVASLQRENRAAIPRVMGALRERYAHLLYELAAHRSDAVVIEKISATREGVDIEGITLDVYDANQLRSTLADHLAPLGWSAEPPTREDMKLFDGGGPWRFVLKLSDRGLGGFMVQEPKP